RYRAARVTLPTWAEAQPDRAVYATNASGVWQVVSWDLAGDRHTTITDKPTGVLGGRATPDGGGVVWFDDAAGDEVGAYVVAPFSGGPCRPLVPDAGTGWSAGLSWRGGRLAMGLSDRDGFRVGVRDDDGYRRVYASVHPASVGGLSRDGTLLALSHTEHGDTIHPALRVVDPRSGDAVGELADGRGNGVSPAGWSPVASDGRLAVLADRTGRTRPEVWTPATGERVALTLDLPGEVSVADWTPDAAALLLAHAHLGRVELHRYDLDSHRMERVGLPDGTLRGARVRDDGTLWYAYTSSAHPPQVRRRSPDGTDEVLLAPPGAPAPDGAAYTSLHYPNGDGDEVHAFLATPAGEAPFPLVVDVHGGPTAQVTDSFDPEIQAWVDHGFAVLQPNYRGSTGYGKAWEDALIGDPGRPELVDVLAGLRHLVDRGVADPARTVLTGASWGGYLTLQGIGTQPDAWTAAVAVVPVADYPTAFADESPVLQEFDRSLFGGTPDELPALYRERSPLTHVDAVRAPVLVVTGANDTRCPKRQVDNYVAALAARGVAHAYDVFEAGHGSLAVDELIRQRMLALDFVAEHLRTPRAQR
ncbi:MAG: prolyl oligopeptidase family serine peptidase, partial [Actinomycetota bacterium]|nr:prolyl oligopeptidase family serine peptidase [Actinomycetota bacterium]